MVIINGTGDGAQATRIGSFASVRKVQPGAFLISVWSIGKMPVQTRYAEKVEPGGAGGSGMSRPASNPSVAAS
jgi:hypothetical protein